jgi:DNA-directed RNA polymerase
MTVTDALAPFITLVKPKKLAVITILEIMRLHGSGGVSEGMKTARALVGVGHGVEVEYQADDLKRREKVSRFPYPLTQSKLGEEGEGEGQGEGDRHGLEKLAERRRDFKANGPLRSNEWVPEWTPTVRAKVGSFLVEALMDVAKVTRTTTHPKTGEP